MLHVCHGTVKFKCGHYGMLCPQCLTKAMCRQRQSCLSSDDHRLNSTRDSILRQTYNYFLTSGVLSYWAGRQNLHHLKVWLINLFMKQWPITHSCYSLLNQRQEVKILSGVIWPCRLRWGEHHLRWFGHVIRLDEEDPVKGSTGV